MRNLYIPLLALALSGCGLLSNNQNEKTDSGKSSVKEQDPLFEGTYKLIDDEGDAYTLTISDFEEGYKLKWETPDGESWQGSGYEIEGVLAVESAKEPGVFGFYEKQGKGLSGIFTTLEGKGYFTQHSKEARALRPSPRNLSGAYNVIGFDASGEGYEDTYYLERSGQTYKVLWSSPEDPVLTGAGIASGDFFVAGVGVGGSIVVRLYKVSGSKLDGRFFYSYFDDEEFKEHLASNGEIAEKE
jgi:uncharacterized protein YceK